MDKDFKTFKVVWDKLNNDRTKEEQDFCLEFKRQILPTMIKLTKATNYSKTLDKINKVPYDKQIEMVWQELYGTSKEQ